jgi:glycosyltransferase involved in cell wall biosynthesis
LANSHFTRASIPLLFPRVPTDVVYLPVQRPDIGDRAAVRRAVRQELGTHDDATVILTSCRIEDLKGHRLLISALTQLREVPDWVCWIAGGAQRRQERALQAELVAACRGDGIFERVQFLGQRADIPRLLAAADVHCQPNTGPDSFGIAFVEALYAELPVVTTAMGGALEIVDKTCGVLVPPNDPVALANELHEIIRDARCRDRLGRAGPARAAALCDPVRQIATLEHRLTAVGRKSLTGHAVSEGLR